MKTTITINCPHCHSARITKKGKKRNAVQNCRRKDCGRQFIAEHERSCNGTIPSITIEILFRLALGWGIREAAATLRVSVRKVLNTLRMSNYRLSPKQPHYAPLKETSYGPLPGEKAEKSGLSTPVAVNPVRLRPLCGANGT